MREETKTKIKSLHKGMMDRCYLKSNSGYTNYGARGVRVAPEWHEVERFIKDVPKIDGWDEESFLAGEIVLDKDKKVWGNKEYSLINCTFITPEENNQYKPNQQHKLVGYSPDKKIYRFHNASQFAREQGLQYWGILSAAHGETDFYKEWQFCKEEDYYEGIFVEPGSQYRWIIGMDPKGKTYRFHNASAFAREHGLLEATVIYACANGKNSNTRSWQFRYEDELESKPFKDPKKLRVQHRGRWVIGVSPEGEVYEFNNRTSFGKNHGLNSTNITKAIKENRPYKGWVFRWKHEEHSYVN